MSTWFRHKRARQQFDMDADSWGSPLTGLSNSLCEFGWELLRGECSRQSKQNVFVSPLSVFLALAMTKNGAVGETETAMRKALALPSYPSDAAINDAVLALLRSLRPKNGIGLVIANALWVHILHSLSQEFVRASEEIYDAVVRQIDFYQSSAADVVNDWVSKKTNDEIRGIVTPGTMRDAPAVLTNAVYFRGKFSCPFPKQETKQDIFYLTDGKEKLVPMMSQVGLFNSYRTGKGFEAAALSYKGSNLILFALLPRKGVRPEEVLSGEAVPELFVEHDEFKLDLSMPRVNVEFATNLKESLEQMGMAIAFQQTRADFSALGSHELCLSNVIHKTKLAVDEEGTVASAVSVVEVFETAPLTRSTKSKTLIFNRPFGILILDRTTGASIFSGTIYDP